MVRRTKEEALATRHRLLDAAELLFHAQGVSRTSLNEIAIKAGATRGAIYWHFKDKADLFNAMMERVTLPLEQALRIGLNEQVGDALGGLRGAIVHSLRMMTTDAQLRRVFEVAMHQVEYVNELQAVRERHLATRKQCVADIALGLRRAARDESVKLAVPAMGAAWGLHGLICGLMQDWLLDPSVFDLVATGEAALDAYLRGLGLQPAPLPQASIPNACG
ncbi:TetR family transcriptional regulator [Rhodoferax koreense]|uniref:TetR family transcriptional regulator n=1 Tax=Rhodoferax koreensis TaxID=1842727 RepID=A0A1P8K237_9BURK|nr:TetR family transcriptional regulator [Rhodoferax koreense]APW40049.1 TetR family transcriptional regulator [Rhodoferax koreense]